MYNLLANASVTAAGFWVVWAHRGLWRGRAGVSCRCVLQVYSHLNLSLKNGIYNCCACVYHDVIEVACSSYK